MPIPQNPGQESPSTYWVQDRSNKDEFTRLRLQDEMLTTNMGGVLPEQANPGIFERVLDVGCGTGGWLIEAAKTYPNMSRLVGVDISGKMTQYANTQAEAQQVSDRVHFQVMDALRTLEFPDASFDLVNLRFGTSFLRTWDWSRLLQEFLRISRPGGVIRITEFGVITETSSPTHKRLLTLIGEALYQAGHVFALHQAVIEPLAELMRKYGVRNVQIRPYELLYRSGTPEGRLFFEDTKSLFQTIEPFLRKWTRVPEDYSELYQQMLQEMQQPDFAATFPIFTVWGENTELPAKNRFRMS